MNNLQLLPLSTRVVKAGKIFAILYKYLDKEYYCFYDTKDIMDKS